MAGGDDESVVTASVAGVWPQPRWLVWFLLGALALGAVGVVAASLFTEEADATLVAFAIAFTLVLAWNAYWWGFRLVLWAQVSPSGMLRYAMALRAGEMPVHDIESIVYRPPLRAYVIRHRRGRVYLLRMARGDELVAELRRRNPRITGA